MITIKEKISFLNRDSGSEIRFHRLTCLGDNSLLRWFDQIFFLGKFFLKSIGPILDMCQSIFAK